MSASTQQPIASSDIPHPAAVRGARDKTFLRKVPGLHPLPSADQAAQSDLPLDEIQGDIIIGMLKPKQTFYFLKIVDVAAFKRNLKTEIAPIITSARQMLDRSQEPLVLLNMAFSRGGLEALGIDEDLGDAVFKTGQLQDAPNLGDVVDTWKDEFKAPANIHAVILIASDTQELIDKQISCIERAFKSSIEEVYRLDASIRPGEFAGHEMFGFKDGIAQPWLKGFGTKLPGQTEVDPGTVVVGLDGDTGSKSRPTDGWATGGSFLAFRQLEQHVPEFNKFLHDNAPAVPGKSLEHRANLLGARMVGRWKSGAPVDLTPHHDDPELGKDPQRNNNFNYEHPNIPGFQFDADQSRCPFSAHIRKTRPRDDLTEAQAPGGIAARSIMRGGIPYGPEVSAEEASSHKTTKERGLAFVAYQSVIANGFQFLQQAWANSPNFVFGKAVQPGFDPIIGQNKGQPRSSTGLDPNNPSGSLTLTEFVVSRGGEYFFSPPVSAFKGRLVM